MRRLPLLAELTRIAVGIGAACVAHERTRTARASLGYAGRPQADPVSSPTAGAEPGEGGAAGGRKRRRGAARTTSCATAPAAIGPAGAQICVSHPAEPGTKIEGPDDVCRLLRGAENADRESFYAIYLNSDGRVGGVEEIARGTLDGVEIHPREVFKGAIVAGAKSLIVAHNHPSGRETPSADDIETTKRLKAAGKILGIPVLDHVVVARRGCTSAMESGDF